MDSLSERFKWTPTIETQYNLEKTLAQVSFENDIKIIIKFTTKKADATVEYQSIKDLSLPHVISQLITVKLIFQLGNAFSGQKETKEELLEFMKKHFMKIRFS